MLSCFFGVIVESVASEMQHGEIHLQNRTENFAKSKQMLARKTVYGDEFAQRKTLQNRSKCMHERRFTVMSLLQSLFFKSDFLYPSYLLVAKAQTSVQLQLQRRTFAPRHSQLASSFLH